MYYLQSRYYDATVGRFINGDSPGYSAFSINAVGHNIFSYCINNPISFTDPMGNIAIFDDIAILSFIGLCAILLLLLSWISIQKFQKSWTTFCTTEGNGLSSIGTDIIQGGTASWDWTRKRVKSATAAINIFIIIARADSKIRSKVKENSKDRYWTATLRSNYVDIGRSITYSKAVKEVSNGRNVFTVTNSEAKAVAKAACSNKKPYGPEIHGDGALGYYYHYHVYNHRKNGHVFFLFW